MPAGAYIATPQTHLGNSTSASYLTMTNGLGRLDELSPEKSFASPSGGGRRTNDLVSQIQNSRRQGRNAAASNAGISLRTPGAGGAGGRDPLRVLLNGPTGRGEFTPLMKSVTKNNLRRTSAGAAKNKKFGVPDTPAFLREGHSLNAGATPGLPRLGDQSGIYGENTGSSATDADAVDYTPMPQNVSSSVKSTPLAQLPGRDGAGLAGGEGNVMTLREQENVSGTLLCSVRYCV